jgi:FtsZ-interacting cell division protein YlmF
MKNDDPLLEDESTMDFPGIYLDPEIQAEENVGQDAAIVSTLNSPARKEPEIHPVTPDKVEVKLHQPASSTEAPKVADKLKEGCIVLLDISNLPTPQAIRLVDFVAGVAYVLGGEMIRTNKNTILVAPSGVDVSSFTTTAPAAEAEETYEEVEETEDEAETEAE